MGFLRSLFSVKKMNADPDQQRLARLFIDAAENGEIVNLTNFIIEQPWSPSDTRNRISHALSIVKISSIPATYERAKKIGWELIQVSYSLG
jgi:hypothetical protein